MVTLLATEAAAIAVFYINFKILLSHICFQVWAYERRTEENFMID